MSKAETRFNFNGPYKGLLGELAGLIEWLKDGHDLSYVKAGDNAVFAYGGDGHVVIFDETVWQGLVELLTPNCTFAIKPGEDGKVVVTSSNPDEKASKQSFKDALAGIRNYYENRYWNTPDTSAGN
jgi:hypothetical protein